MTLCQLLVIIAPFAALFILGKYLYLSLGTASAVFTVLGLLAPLLILKIRKSQKGKFLKYTGLTLVTAVLLGLGVYGGYSLEEEQKNSIIYQMTNNYSDFGASFRNEKPILDERHMHPLELYFYKASTIQGNLGATEGERYEQWKAVALPELEKVFGESDLSLEDLSFDHNQLMASSDIGSVRLGDPKVPEKLLTLYKELEAKGAPQFLMYNELCKAKSELHEDVKALKAGKCRNIDVLKSEWNIDVKAALQEEYDILRQDVQRLLIDRELPYPQCIDHGNRMVETAPGYEKKLHVVSMISRFDKKSNDHMDRQYRRDPADRQKEGCRCLDYDLGKNHMRGSCKSTSVGALLNKEHIRIILDNPHPAYVKVVEPARKATMGLTFPAKTELGIDPMVCSLLPSCERLIYDSNVYTHSLGRLWAQELAN